ncbi:MAG: zinc-ribbon domain-containing protein [Candidatus Hodarchaeota archaeon]
MTIPYDPFGFMFMIIPIITFLTCCLSIVFAIWVYKDAQKRDMDATVWLLVVLIAGCIGCIIYLIVRHPIGDEVSKQPSYTPEPSYQPQDMPATPYTPEKPTEISTKYCRNCGEKIPYDATYCPICGSRQ